VTKTDKVYVTYNDVKAILFGAPGQLTYAYSLVKYALCNYVMALKFSAFVSYVFGKILVRFHRFITYFKEVWENVSITSEQPSYFERHGISILKRCVIFFFLLEMYKNVNIKNDMLSSVSYRVIKQRSLQKKIITC
jgi:hypothetical protein